MKQNRLLIVTSKCPDIQDDFDGGSILINQLVKYAPKFFNNIDIIYLRNSKCTHTHTKINNIQTIRQISKSNNKFIQRIDNSHNTFQIIKNISTIYDKIMVTHASNAFHLEKLSNKELKKIIIFPMFTSVSYINSNEIVPSEYIDMEKKILKKCIKIITPSLVEKQQLINDFHVKRDNIKVVPRGFDLDIFYKKPTFRLKKLQIICVGSIRQQKNHKELINKCLYLINKNIDFNLHLVGGHEEKYKNDFFEEVKNNSLDSYIIHHGILTPDQLSKLMDICDINISVSIMETFGRSIYEGLLKGLPTIVFDHLSCLWENLQNNYGIVGVDSSEKFTEEIIKLYTDKEHYRNMQKQALSYRMNFSDKILISNIFDEIIG